MNIKQEPEDMVDPVAQYDVQWENYKKEFEECEFAIKSGKYDAESVYNIKDKSACQIFAPTPPICSSKPLSNRVPYLRMKVNVKREPTDYEEMDIDCSENCDFLSKRSFPKLVAVVIRMNRVQFYGKNFICNVCYSIFPTIGEKNCHQLLHEQSVGRMVKRESSGQDNLINDKCALKTEDYMRHGALNNKAHKEETRCVKIVLKCEECSYECQEMRKLKRHKMSHSLEKPFKCDKCDYACMQSNDLKRHKMTHSGDKPFKCDKCDYSCIFSSQIKSHKMIHSGEKPFKCEECDYSCIRLCNMKIHKATHSGENLFKCRDCGFSCQLYYTLKKHQMIHSGRKPFNCAECEYSCIQSNDMKRHRMTHSGEKPFICKDCDYSCIRFSHMKRHKFVHSGNKPFKCEQCNYSCIQSTNMKRHIMIHSGGNHLDAKNPIAHIHQ